MLKNELIHMLDVENVSYTLRLYAKSSILNANMAPTAIHRQPIGCGKERKAFEKKEKNSVAMLAT